MVNGWSAGATGAAGGPEPFRSLEGAVVSGITMAAFACSRVMLSTDLFRFPCVLCYCRHERPSATAAATSSSRGSLLRFPICG